MTLLVTPESAYVYFLQRQAVELARQFVNLLLKPRDIGGEGFF